MLYNEPQILFGSSWVANMAILALKKTPKNGHSNMVVASGSDDPPLFFFRGECPAFLSSFLALTIFVFLLWCYTRRAILDSRSGAIICK